MAHATLYVIKHDLTGLFKIGITNDWGRRQKQLEVGTKTSPLHIVRVNDARQVERFLHKRFTTKRMPQSEWFHLDDPDLAFVRSTVLKAKEDFNASRATQHIDKPLQRRESIEDEIRKNKITKQQEPVDSNPLCADNFQLHQKESAAKEARVKPVRKEEPGIQDKAIGLNPRPTPSSNYGDSTWTWLANSVVFGCIVGAGLIAATGVPAAMPSVIAKSLLNCPDELKALKTGLCREFDKLESKEGQIGLLLGIGSCLSIGLTNISREK